MIKRYVCKHCNDLPCETSVCPVCGSRADLIGNDIYWSDEQNCPVIGFHENDSSLRKIAKDIRPVFPPERLLIEIIWGKPFAYCNEAVWSVGSNTYVINGKRKKLDYQKYLQDNTVEDLRNRLIEFEAENEKYCKGFYNSSTIRNFIDLNAEYLNVITSEAIEYIKSISSGRQMDELFVSFSGGKDSTVTSDLVLRALGTQSVLHFYGDTTLEYPESAEYLARFKKDHPATPILVARNNEQDFLSLCKLIGPPSRLLRWCCTVFKTGAISQKIEQVFKDKKQILSFQGIRRSESNSRSKYEREINSPKIAKQIAASPIIDWFDVDIWLYILSNHIDINSAYEKGFTRVGCWCCPHNSQWSRFLASIYMADETKEFNDFLYDFAKRIGKEDWKAYIDEGKWCARQGGNGLDASKNTIVSYQPCATEENTLNFQLNYPISESLYTYFKPFGLLDFSMGRKRLDEVYVLDRKTKMPIIRLSGKKGTKNLKISIVGKHPAFKSQRIVESLIRAQITKFQSCVGCNGCQGACKHNAIHIFNTDKQDVSRDTIQYSIDTDKCIGCLECVSHFEGGCLMYKVLKTKNN